jgi:hypothetical protein
VLGEERNSRRWSSPRPLRISRAAREKAVLWLSGEVG